MKSLVEQEASPTRNYITVLIATYNSDLIKTIYTIESVLIQTGCAVQLVIADDGSNDNHFTIIRELLCMKSFEDYVLVPSSKNRGTVNNLLHAMQFVQAPLVKLLSPGDYLYRATTLEETIHSMTLNESSACFGRAVFYASNRDEGIRVLPNRNPAVEAPYTRQAVDLKRAKRYQIAYVDWVVGALLAYRTCRLTECLKLMANRIVLTEDVAVRMLLANGENISFIQDYVVWYEWGTGVSTPGKGARSSLMLRDYAAQIDLLTELYPDDKDVQRMAQDERRRANGTSRILRGVLDPGRLVFKLRDEILRLTYRPRNVDLTSYQEITTRGEKDYAALCQGLKMDESQKGAEQADGLLLQ